MQDLNHQHVMIHATFARPPKTVEEMDAWLVDVVDAVDMKVLMGPFSTHCATPGNVGVTGVIVLETSHASAHCWDEAKVPFMNCDLYSCKRFDVEAIIEILMRFEPYYVHVMLVDRNHNGVAPGSVSKTPNKSSVQVLTQFSRQFVDVIDLLSPEERTWLLEAQNLPKSEQTALHRLALASLKKATQLYTYNKKHSSPTIVNTFEKIIRECDRKGMDFDLTQDWFKAEVRKAKTIWPKILEFGHDQSFWLATVDRINDTCGYTKNNCRVIPYALHLAKWKWNKREIATLMEIFKNDISTV